MKIGFESSAFVVVIDTISAISTHEESVDLTEASPAVSSVARWMAYWFRDRLLQLIAGRKIVIIFLNQMRDIIRKFGHGPTQSSPGGRALKQYASIRLLLEHMEDDKETNDLGFNVIRKRLVRATIQKHKLRRRYKVDTPLTLDLENGFHSVGSAVEYAVEKKILTLTGSRYEWNGKQYYRNDLIEFLSSDPDQFVTLLEYIEKSLA